MSGSHIGESGADLEEQSKEFDCWGQTSIPAVYQESEGDWYSSTKKRLNLSVVTR